MKSLLLSSRNRKFLYLEFSCTLYLFLGYNCNYLCPLGRRKEEEDGTVTLNLCFLKPPRACSSYLCKKLLICDNMA